jgi:hypothetical protein
MIRFSTDHGCSSIVNRCDKKVKAAGASFLDDDDDDRSPRLLQQVPPTGVFVSSDNMLLLSR